MYFSKKVQHICSFRFISITNNNDDHPFMFRGKNRKKFGKNVD